MTIGQRLARFITRVYGSQLVFAKKFGFAKEILNRYVKDRNVPGADKLIIFQKAGLSIDWLLSGKGKMLLEDHSIVQELQESDKKMFPLSRLKQWIIDNFTTIANYSFMINYNLNDLNYILSNNNIPDPEFINIISLSGCNINWLCTGEGSEYANNYIGSILKKRKVNPDLVSKSESSIDLRKINDLSTTEFYELIKDAVKEQIEQIQGDSDEN